MRQQDITAANSVTTSTAGQIAVMARLKSTSAPSVYWRLRSGLIFTRQRKSTDDPSDTTITVKSQGGLNISRGEVPSPLYTHAI